MLTLPCIFFPAAIAAGLVTGSAAARRKRGV